MTRPSPGPEPEAAEEGIPAWCPLKDDPIPTLEARVRELERKCDHEADVLNNEIDLLRIALDVAAELYRFPVWNSYGNALITEKAVKKFCIDEAKRRMR